MLTAHECYEMADRCERQAAEAKSPQAREILLEVAAKWRQLGDDIKTQPFPGGVARQPREDS
jgi:hypothetical protein